MESFLKCFFVFVPLVGLRCGFEGLFGLVDYLSGQNGGFDWMIVIGSSKKIRIY
jgi:hypothetical protein